MTASGSVPYSPAAWSYYIAFLVFAGYFILLTLYYIFLAGVGFIEGKKRFRESEDEIYHLLSASIFSLPVSIIIPARNEENWIADSVRSVLRLNYPEFEVIIVDDGSSDATLQALDGVLSLKGYDKTYVKKYHDGQVREIFKSDVYPNVTVISKYSGYKKAGAVNAGLNLARYKYICVIDADTILEPDILMKVMAQVHRNPEHVIGVGSYFGISNGLGVKDGVIIDRNFSYNPISAYQNLEYIRSFIGNRIAWSKFNAMPNVAGGFGLWRRDIVHELGGYDTEFTCEDIEYTFRAHDYAVKNKKKGYRIVMLPYIAGWTEGPARVSSLILQRNRWQRVINETIWKYKYMILNPRFGSFGFLTLPYFVIYEVFGVFVEAISIATLGVGAFLGFFRPEVFFAFFCLMFLSGALISILSLFAFIRIQKVFKFRYILYLLGLSFLEYFGYRWLIVFAKISGTFSYFRRDREYTMYAREKRAPSRE